MRRFLLTWDERAGAAYVYVGVALPYPGKGVVAQTDKVNDALFVDLGKHGELLGIEALNPSRVTLADLFKLVKEDDER